MIVPAEKLGPAWWNEFLQVTENMSAVAVFKDCLTSEETARMRSCVLQILAELARLRTQQYGYRVYVDGLLLEPNQMLHVYDHPPRKGESLADWARRTFEDKNFGMIINQCERFNLELSNMMAFKLAPLLEKTGIPTEGIIFHLFIGNYDVTPLGIHVDSPGRSAIHFHLGPGPKTMYTWNAKEYLSLVGEASCNNKDLDKYIPVATRSSFGEGDLYYMPENTYHVGTQEGLSIGLVCWCNNRASYDLALRLQELLSEQFLRRSERMLKPDRNGLDDHRGVEETLELFDLPEPYEGLTFKDLLRRVYRDLRYSLHSNAGYRTTPFPDTADRWFALDDVVEAEKPYRMIYAPLEGTDKLVLYVRGAKIELNNFECIKRLVDVLNQGDRIRVRDLLAVLDEDWPEEHGLYLLELIRKHHGLKLAG